MKSERGLLKVGLVFSALAHVVLIAWLLRPQPATVRSASPVTHGRITRVRIVSAETLARTQPDVPSVPLAAVNSVRPVSAPKVDGNEALRAKVTASKHVAHKTPQVADEQPLEEQGTAASTEAQLFQQALSEHIGQYRKYPERARQGAMSGVVEVGFTMDRSGAVLKVWIRHDSGFVLLDGEAIATIWRAQPLPRIPPNLPDRLDVFLPISFSLT